MENELIQQPQPINAPQKKNKGLILTTVFFALISLGLGGFLIYHFVTVSHDNNSPCGEGAKCNVPSDKDAGDDSAADYDVKIKEVVEEVWATDTLSNSYYVEKIRTYNQTFPLLKIEGTSTVIQAEKSYGVYFEISNPSTGIDVYGVRTEISNKVGDKLQSIGFSKSTDYDNTPSYIINGTPYYKDDISCLVADGPMFEQLFVGCGYNSWVSSENTDLAKALLNAYHTKTNDYPTTIYVKDTEIKNSSVSPYQTISVGTSNAAGLFYRVSPDAEWQYFTSTQAELECSEYNTEDLKKAYAGDKCWDGLSDATVQP